MTEESLHISKGKNSKVYAINIIQEYDLVTGRGRGRRERKITQIRNSLSLKLQFQFVFRIKSMSDV